MDNRSESTVALTSYVSCSEGFDGGIIGPASSVYNLSKGEDKNEVAQEPTEKCVTENKGEVLINVNRLSWNTDINNGKIIPFNDKELSASKWHLFLTIYNLYSSLMFHNINIKNQLL